MWIFFQPAIFSCLKRERSRKSLSLDKRVDPASICSAYWPISLLQRRANSSTHLDSFFMSKCSCRMFHTRSSEMFTISTISLTFTLRSTNTISWIISFSSYLNRAFWTRSVTYAGLGEGRGGRERERERDFWEILFLWIFYEILLISSLKIYCLKINLNDFTDIKIKKIKLTWVRDFDQFFHQRNETCYWKKN